MNAEPGEPITVAGLPALSWGDPDAPLTLCLHGFPDLPHTFEALASQLSHAGHRVVAPYLPGYAPAPRLARADLDSVASVLAGLAHALSPARPYLLLGHDWGAALAYTLTARNPARIRALVSLAVPHPAAFARVWLRSAEQRRASAYMLAFQLPGADARLRAHDQRAMGRLWRRWSPGFSPSDVHLSRVKRCLDASAGAPVDYYRHNLRPVRPALARWRRLAHTPWSTPTLHLHGEDDGCMRPRCAHESLRYLGARGQIDVIEGVGHFLHLERPEAIAARITAFLESLERESLHAHQG